MATLYKRGKTWWGRFQYRGKEVRQSLETASRAVASQRVHKWEAKVKAEAWGEGAGRTYDDAMESFLLNHCPTLRPASALRYRTSAKPLTQFFTGMALSAITSSKLASYVGQRRLTASAPTIRRDLACLSSMYTHAIVDLEWCETNPVLSFLKRQKRRGALRESPPKTRYLSKDEETTLLGACTSEDIANSIAFAIDTGLRLEEQFSLTWDRVDLKKRELIIPKEIAKSRKERRVPLLPRAAQILAQLPRGQYVWANAEGKRYGERKRGLATAIKRAQIAKLTWHDLRRTCGCRLLQEYRLSMPEVQKWLGHESVQQTERAYAFLDADALQRAVQNPAQSVGFLDDPKRRKGKKTGPK